MQTAALWTVWDNLFYTYRQLYNIAILFYDNAVLACKNMINYK